MSLVAGGSFDAAMTACVRRELLATVFAAPSGSVVTVEGKVFLVNQGKGK